jgi:hypothetical protein
LSDAAAAYVTTVRSETDRATRSVETLYRYEEWHTAMRSLLVVSLGGVIIAFRSRPVSDLRTAYRPDVDRSRLRSGPVREADYLHAANRKFDDLVAEGEKLRCPPR